MKNLIYACLASVFLLHSCEVAVFDCVDGVGPVIEKTIVLSGNVSKIESEIGADLVISQGATQEIKIVGQENIINLIEQESDDDGDKWKIKAGKCISTDNVTIHLQLVSFESLVIKGTGSVTSEGLLENIEDLKLEIEGSGDIFLDNIMATKIDLQIQGQGDVKLQGTTIKSKIDIEGTGDVLCRALIAEDVEVDIDGQGDVEVFASKTLDVDINGSGDVCFLGNPTIKTDIDGTGDVSSCN